MNSWIVGILFISAKLFWRLQPWHGKYSGRHWHCTVTKTCPTHCNVIANDFDWNSHCVLVDFTTYPTVTKGTVQALFFPWLICYSLIFCFREADLFTGPMSPLLPLLIQQKLACPICSCSKWCQSCCTIIVCHIPLCCAHSCSFPCLSNLSSESNPILSHISKEPQYTLLFWHRFAIDWLFAGM